MVGRSSAVFKKIRHGGVLAGVCVSLWCCPHAGAVTLADIPAGIVHGLESGTAQDAIILYDDPDVEKRCGEMRRSAALAYDDEAILAFRVRQYRILKNNTSATIQIIVDPLACFAALAARGTPKRAPAEAL